MEQTTDYSPSWLLDILLKEYYQLTGEKSGLIKLWSSSSRDKFFLNLDFSHDVFERNKVQRFYKLYGREILQKYRKKQPTEPKYKNAPTFREFIDYLVDLPLRRLDIHWLPTYLQCMPCHIKYDILGRYDTYNCFFTLHQILSSFVELIQCQRTAEKY